MNRSRDYSMVRFSTFGCISAVFSEGFEFLAKFVFPPSLLSYILTPTISYPECEVRGREDFFSVIDVIDDIFTGKGSWVQKGKMICLRSF